MTASTVFNQKRNDRMFETAAEAIVVVAVLAVMTAGYFCVKSFFFS